MAAPYIDLRNFKVLVQDTFLLPNLPKKNNDNPFVNDLPKMLIFVLEKAQQLLPEDTKNPLRNWPRIMHNFVNARSEGKICENRLLKLLNEEHNEPIPLYLPHHNAGVTIRWAERRIEAFQLSPRVQAVTATTGRLRRKFPEISVTIDENTASNKSFLKVLAETFAELDKCEVTGVKPTRKIKNKVTEQTFDATLPNHIFDPLFAWLCSEKSTTTDAHEDTSIVKHTRDYVLVTETESATIRRSPVWLLFKVVLQQELCVRGPSPDHTVYRKVMLLFFSSLLQVACERKLDSDTIHLMRRKIGYRAMKLQAKLDHEKTNQLMECVHASVKEAATLLRRRHDAFIKKGRSKIPERIPPFSFDAAMGRVKLPQLDSFLCKAQESKPSPQTPVSDPKADSVVWDSDKLPNVKKIGGGSAAENVHSFILVEYWVEDHLDSFIETSATDSLCSSIRTLAVNYFERARVAYQDHPYHLSVMILTLLELWVACDKVAVRCNPLMSEYTPMGIESVNWDNLLLRTAKDRLRLGRAEDYIAVRASKKRSMVAEYGGPGCFASQFAQASEPHKKLMERIENESAQKKKTKEVELNKEKKRQKVLLDVHATSFCDPAVCTVGTSNILCKRCNYLATARAIRIRPYCKLLPDAIDAAYAIVFELQVPGDIAAWRDFCFFLQLDVAGYNIKGNAQASYSYLKSYEPLAPYYQAHTLETKSRICLAAKPSGRSTASKLIRQNTSVEELIMPCCLKWEMFDSRQQKFISTIQAGWAIADMCRMKLDDQNHVLQKVLEMDAQEGMNPNELITMRDEEENTSRIKHNEELASLCFGNNVTWPKILHSLRGSSIDWTASETFLFISQAILQASPGNGEHKLRQRHAQLLDPEFARKLLTEVQRQLQFYTSSFSGRVAIAVFCTITIKLIADGPNLCKEMENAILSQSRKACFRWMQEIRPMVHDSTSEMYETQLELALVYAHTLNLDNGRLKPILQDDEVAEGYVLASTIIQESKSHISTTFQKSLYSSGLRLAVNASQILGGLIKKGQTYGISNGIYYSLGRPVALCVATDRCEMRSGSWMKTYLISPGGMISQTIHIDLMTAELLIDGKSPRHLSATFTSHKDFMALFGSLSPAVTATTDPRYEYKFKQPFKGFTIEVGLERDASEKDKSHPIHDLHVRATKDGAAHVLIPRRVLSASQFQFPSRYRDDYLHWSTLSQSSKQVDFYSSRSPWDSCSLSWRLSEEEGEWLLRDHKQDRTVLPIGLEYHQSFLRIFKYLIAKEDLTVVLNTKKRNLEIHLRSLGLNFFVPDGSSVIHSVEHENMCISHDYWLGTLLGCRSTLALYNRLNTSSKIVLVPDGEVEYERCKGDMRVQVDIKADSMVHVYRVDERLGQLKPNQTWRSKAYLAYLSALTSCCLPDPLTGKTGQETALDILQSEALTSFFALKTGDYKLLDKISKLSPVRKLLKKTGASLPAMEWDSKLGMAVHHEGYWLAVQRILDSAEMLEMFKRTSIMDRQVCAESEKRLRVADSIRFACFRTERYGAEQRSDDAVYYFRMPTTKKELKEAKGQMRYGNSKCFQRSYLASFGAKHCSRFSREMPTPSAIWGSVAKGGITKGATGHYKAENFKYSAGFLSKENNTLEEDFCSIHQALSELRGNLNGYRVRLWLATVACGMSDESAAILVPVLSAIWRRKVPVSVQIPTTTNTGADDGIDVTEDKIVAALEGARLSFDNDRMDIDESDEESEEDEEDKEDEEDEEGEEGEAREEEVGEESEEDEDDKEDEQGEASEEEVEEESEEDAFIREQDEAFKSLAKEIARKGPMNLEEYSSYLNVKRAETAIQTLHSNCNLNQLYTDYFEHLSKAVSSLCYRQKGVEALLYVLPPQDDEHKRGYITLDAIMEQQPEQFTTNNEWRRQATDQIREHVQTGKHSIQPAVHNLLQTLEDAANKQHEKDYSDRLCDSAAALDNYQSTTSVSSELTRIAHPVKSYRSEIETRLEARLEEANAAAHRVTSKNATFSEIVKYTDIFPRVSLRFFLELLSFSKRPNVTEPWLPLLKQIAVLCRDLLHMDRILKACKNGGDIVSELRTIDRYSYGDSAFPDVTLFEISNNMCVRPNQLEIMHQMKDPPNGENSVMQLNMGEGKSSVIIPILSASLAQGHTLVRVFVGKHQSMQMNDTMTAAMGGLINRPVFYMPFSRESKLTNSEIGKLQESFVRCAKAGGVLLLQPEHHLSLLLSTCLNEDTSETGNYVALLKYIKSNSRDIIDECDEILSPTYELIYTIGNSGPVDFAPDRWTILQGILGLLAAYCNPKAGVITEKEVIYQTNIERPDAYPTIRFLTLDGLKKVLNDVARKFVGEGIPGFPVGRYSRTEKAAIYNFITEKAPEANIAKKMARFGSTAKSAIALVRGCITGDLIRAALVQKRFRVGYGNDFVRLPSTRLAVPFAAKDVPKPRSEFSNVDIVILFTQLSYYHSGLREQDVREVMNHVSSSDDGREVYKSWFNERSKMPNSLTALTRINLQDNRQFHNDFFPNIAHSMKAINYFLSRIVFPKELGAFSRYMSASGWDLGVKKDHPTTGFSGTTDLCALLPLDMKQHDLPSQKHTNALVINNMLDSQNTVVSMHKKFTTRSSNGTALIHDVIRDGRFRVLLDAGAQIIKYSNQQVAEEWLNQTADEEIEAVIFFDDFNQLSVIDRKKTIKPLNVSTYAKKLEACAVFLDEAHTRGTDLRLPRHYKAAVTLGAGLTKDALAQTCMRMRNLGNGQTLTFYVSFEVESDIRNFLNLDKETPLATEHIIVWSIAQTWTSLQRQMPYWAKQGERHLEQSEAWQRIFDMENTTSNDFEDIQKKFSQKADARGSKTNVAGSASSKKNADNYHKIKERCDKFGCSATANEEDVDETCEREVAPEVEDEKQVSKPAKPEAREEEFKNEALKGFIKGSDIKKYIAIDFEYAFESLKTTTLMNMPEMKQFPRNLLVTRDFAHALRERRSTDKYQRSVVCVLYIKPRLVKKESQQQVIIISEAEADRYWDQIADSQYVGIHYYNAKTSSDDPRQAEYMTYPMSNVQSLTYPTVTRIVLDLFAGQLYFTCLEEYYEVSSFLGLAYFRDIDTIEVQTDGFIPPAERHKIKPCHLGPTRFWDTFTTSPVAFLKKFLCVVRNHGASIEDTHMGRILNGERLETHDFKEDAKRGRPVTKEEMAQQAPPKKKPRLESRAQQEARLKKKTPASTTVEKKAGAEPAAKKSAATKAPTTVQKQTEEAATANKPAVTKASTTAKKQEGAASTANKPAVTKASTTAKKQAEAASTAKKAAATKAATTAKQTREGEARADAAAARTRRQTRANSEDREKMENLKKMKALYRNRSTEVERSNKRKREDEK